MSREFDAASVASTTRFLARGEQPLGSAVELESIEVPVAVLPGADPQHPAEIAALYARHLPHPTVIEQTAPDMLAQLAEFCSSLPWRKS